MTELLNIGLALLEGIGLIVSPCILPILPFILSGSLTGSRKRPLGIILGFVIMFALFTFFSRQLVQATGIDLNIIRYVSYAALLLFGMIMLSTHLTEYFAHVTRRLSQMGSGAAILQNTEGGVMSGILFGALVAIIWTPCAGPILAAVIVQAVLQHTTLGSFFVVLAFAVGAAIPMLLIAIFGRTIIEKTRFLKAHTIKIRQLLGAIIIVAVGYMIYSEKYAVVTATSSATSNNTQTQLIDGLSMPYPAPALKDISAWINSPPLQLNQLKGKVVLIDFWTYSCINCIRTLPYLLDWYNKYHDKGLVLIGVHTPEFELEKNLDNVKVAVQKYGIHYPVALDDQFGTWTNYQNHYWPAHYLIDKNGYVVYEHFGEGEYDITENNIRYLLGLNTMPTPKTSYDATSFNQTPETYLGYARADHFFSPEIMEPNKSTNYTYPVELKQHAWATARKLADFSG